MMVLVLFQVLSVAFTMTLQSRLIHVYRQRHFLDRIFFYFSVDPINISFRLEDLEILTILGLLIFGCFVFFGI